MKKYLKKLGLIRSVLALFWTTEGFLSATALAYTTLLSIVPLTVLSLGIFSLFPSFKIYIEEANNYLFEHFVPTSANEIAKNIELFTKTAMKYSLMGFLFSLVSSLILIFSLESSFNMIWQLKTRRPFLIALGIYCAALVLLPTAGGAVFAINVFLHSLPITYSLKSFFSFLPLFKLLAMIFTWLTFFLLYKFLPNCPVQFRHAAIGALIAAVLFEILKRVFGIYIVYFSSFTIIYGTLAAIPIFLTWLYLSWIVVLLGVAISAQLAKTNLTVKRHKIH